MFICVANAIIIAICIPVLVILVILRQYAMYSLRELRRLESACKSYYHLFSHIDPNKHGTLTMLTQCQINIDLMLGQLRKRWSNRKSKSGRYILFAPGMIPAKSLNIRI